MRYLMLAAGAGSRFKAKGYTTNKPFINVYNDTPMFQVVIDSYRLKNSDVDILVRTEDYDRVADLGFRSVHTVDATTPGPAYSAMALMLATGMPMSESMFIFDCDCTANIDLKQAMWKFPVVSNGVIAYRDYGLSEEYSFLGMPMVSSVDVDTGRFQQLREKERISQFINTGCYYFMSAHSFLTAFREMSIDIGAETPLSSVLNHSNVPLRYVESPVFHNFGTPEHLEAFQASLPI